MAGQGAVAIRPPQMRVTDPGGTRRPDSSSCPLGALVARQMEIANLSENLNMTEVMAVLSQATREVSIREDGYFCMAFVFSPEDALRLYVSLQTSR